MTPAACHGTLEERKRVATRRVVLVGQPNVGKSVLFNALTGKYVMVSNYPGTTVDVSTGAGKLGAEPVEIVDSPGIRSLAALSEEERVTRALLFGRPDVLVQVADAKNLPRALALTLELAELRLPMVLCLNMKDEALSRGYRIDAERLSALLGIPVVETTATTRDGLEDLKAALGRAAISQWRNDYPPEIRTALGVVETLVPPGSRRLSPLILQNHLTPQESSAAGLAISPSAFSAIDAQRRKFLRPVADILLEARQEAAGQLAAEVLTRPEAASSGRLARFLEAFGRWALRPWPGYLLAALALCGVYEFVGVFGAQYAVNFLEKVCFGRWLNPLVAEWAARTIPWEFVRGLLVGPYGVFTMALTYAFALILPIVTTFFLALGILEDSGYLPRLSVLLNRFFRLMGLNGKAVFPMILGLGCGTMAVLTTRILDSKKERVLASFLLALAVPCSAQLGVILGMSAGMSSRVLALWLVVTVGSLLAAGALASRVLPGAPSAFLLEIPPIRVPQMTNLGRKVFARLKWYLREVVPLFIYSTAGLYVLDYVGWLKAIERLGAPLVTGVMGLPEQATGAFLIGFLRRDYGAAGLYRLQREGLLNTRQSAVAIIAITLFMPCIAQWLILARERGLRAASAISAAVLAYALVVSGAVNQLLLWAGWS